MKFLTQLIILLVSVSAYSGIEERSFKVKPGGTVNVRLNSADIVVNTWSRNELLVKTNDEGELRISNNGDRIDISSTDDYYISIITLNIPENFNVMVGNSAGNIKINGNLKGNLQVNNQAGDLSFNNIYGNVFIHTSGGNINGSDINGSTDINSSGGDIHLGSLKGTASIRTGGGNIHIGDVLKIIHVKTSGGNIKLKAAAGNGDIYTGGGNIELFSSSGNLKLHSMGGNININEAKGSTDIKTYGGTIRIKSLKGRVSANAESGDIFVNLTSQTSRSEFLSGNGDIRISVPSNLKATIHARAFDPEWWKDKQVESEGIKSDFEVTTLNRDKHEQKVEAIYNVNGGGILIRVQTGYGNIAIRKN